MLKDRFGQDFAGCMTIGDAARLLGLSTGTLRNWDRRGKLRAGRHPETGYRIYRHEDLRAFQSAGVSCDGVTDEFDAPFNRGETAATGHFVQFYESDEFLQDTVGRFVGDALNSDGSGLVIATRAHRDGIDQRLKDRGIDVDAAVSQGRYVALDAVDTLTRIMVDGEPDSTRYAEAIGSVVARLGDGRRVLRAFDETVALLWAEGNPAAAIFLEERWNDLGRQYTFALLCGYPIAIFDANHGGDRFADLCSSHTRVGPAETYMGMTSADERLRAVAELQHKARVLHAEIAHREAVEQRLLVLEQQHAAELADLKLLHETRSWLAAIVDSSQDAIVSKTPDGMILSWNKGAELIFGYTAEEAVGRPITLIIPPDRLDEEQSILDRIRRGEQIEHYETVRQRKDGRRMDISVAISPVRDRAGRIVAASKVARDITDRKRADEALRESERRFRLALASGTVTVFEQDTQLRYTWLYPPDPAFPDGYLGRTDLELLPPGEGGELTRLKRQVLETNEPVHATTRVNLSGETRYHNLVIEPRRDWEGRLVGICGAVVDVTALKNVEAVLREADRRKDEFLAVLAHELRNPLAPMLNALHIMRMAGDNVAASRQVRAMMERQIQQMVRLVDDLMDVSRITRGNVVLKKERVALSSVVASAVETSRPLIEAPGAGHALHVSIPADEVELEADAARLAQVLSNLLNNAAKYSEPRGQIWLCAEVHDDGYLTVLVRDDGIGIPPEMLPRIFDMFVQVDRSSTKTQGGLGVGLTLVRTLVEMHGGSVTVRSDGPGRGSEFAVRLPLPAEHTSSSAGPDGNACSGGASHKRRVLVVDDNADAAQSFAMLLQVLGHEVRIAADGPAALETVRDFQPQVAFLDLGMPGMSGYELARRLRESTHGGTLLLVALTGWGQDEDRRRAREAGFDEHLTKPAEIEAVEAILARPRVPHA